MALSGARLTSALTSDILAALQSAYPVPSNLQAAEKTAMASAQSSLATAIANGSGGDIVSEITGHAVVPIGILGSVSTGAGAPGTTVTTGTGTVT